VNWTLIEERFFAFSQNDTKIGFFLSLFSLSHCRGSPQFRKPDRLKPVLLDACNRRQHGKRWIVCVCATGGRALPLETARTETTQKVLLIWILGGPCWGMPWAYAYFFSRPSPKLPWSSRCRARTALAMAKQFAATQGAQLGGYDSSIVFEVDDEAKTYLEREVGLQQANRMMTNEVQHLVIGRLGSSVPCKKKNSMCVSILSAASSATCTNSKKPRPARASNAPRPRPRRNPFWRDALHTDLSLYDFREEEAKSDGAPGASRLEFFPGSGAAFPCQRTRRTA